METANGHLWDLNNSWVITNQKILLIDVDNSSISFNKSNWHITFRAHILKLQPKIDILKQCLIFIFTLSI